MFDWGELRDHAARDQLGASLAAVTSCANLWCASGLVINQKNEPAPEEFEPRIRRALSMGAQGIGLEDEVTASTALWDVRNGIVHDGDLPIFEEVQPHLLSAETLGSHLYRAIKNPPAVQRPRTRARPGLRVVSSQYQAMTLDFGPSFGCLLAALQESEDILVSALAIVFAATAFEVGVRSMFARAYAVDMVSHPPVDLEDMLTDAERRDWIPAARDLAVAANIRNRFVHDAATPTRENIAEAVQAYQTVAVATQEFLPDVDVGAVSKERDRLGKDLHGAREQLKSTLQSFLDERAPAEQGVRSAKRMLGRHLTEERCESAMVALLRCEHLLKLRYIPPEEARATIEALHSFRNSLYESFIKMQIQRGRRDTVATAMGHFHFALGASASASASDIERLARASGIQISNLPGMLRLAERARSGERDISYNEITDLSSATQRAVSDVVYELKQKVQAAERTQAKASAPAPVVPASRPVQVPSMESGPSEGGAWFWKLLAVVIAVIGALFAIRWVALQWGGGRQDGSQQRDEEVPKASPQPPPPPTENVRPSAADAPHAYRATRLSPAPQTDEHGLVRGWYVQLATWEGSCEKMWSSRATEVLRHGPTNIPGVVVVFEIVAATGAKQSVLAVLLETYDEEVSYVAAFKQKHPSMWNLIPRYLDDVKVTSSDPQLGIRSFNAP